MGEPPIELFVSPAGDVRFLHTDAAMARALPLGRPAIARASHVEPDEHGRWVVDLSPLRGPTLGPFAPDARAEALAAEVAWLRRYYFGYHPDAPPGEDLHDHLAAVITSGPVS